MIASRRKFLFGAAALALAPALVRAESIMRIKPPTLILYGDGIHDDTVALQAVTQRKRVWLANANRWHDPVDSNRVLVPRGKFRLSGAIILSGQGVDYDFNAAALDISGVPTDMKAFKFDELAQGLRIVNCTVINAAAPAFGYFSPPNLLPQGVVD